MHCVLLILMKFSTNFLFFLILFMLAFYDASGKKEKEDAPSKEVVKPKEVKKKDGPLIKVGIGERCEYHSNCNKPSWSLLNIFCNKGKTADKICCLEAHSPCNSEFGGFQCCGSFECVKPSYSILEAYKSFVVEWRKEDENEDLINAYKYILANPSVSFCLFNSDKIKANSKKKRLKEKHFKIMKKSMIQ